ncbi:MAG: sodium:alanine symporter family protein [Bdellovibrionaceae bacterium]|nr:sodium:alanine symporter family protein [Pseudobdellovibrionaceae bacterium]
MQAVNEFLAVMVGYVWNIPMVVLLAGTGLVLTFLLKGIQIKGFIHAFDVIRGRFDDPNDPGEISHFQALTTALSATVGLGNIAGVAVAIHVGGPGATFWMIVVGLLGMATKFAECSLAVKYRKVDENGVVHGGPMYYIEHGLGPAWKPLAAFFAFACVASSFGASNMFQTNQVASILEQSFQVPPLATGVILAILVGVVIIGGIKRIGSVTSTLVPLMGGIYIVGALIVIFVNIKEVPHLFGMIISDAFSGTKGGEAFAGGVIGVLIQGVRRACFSNEAGLGSAPIAHAAAHTNEPIREGVVALLEPLIDTVVICTMTALVILLSGAWTQDANGVDLTAIAFDSAIPGFGVYFVPIAVALFAYSTLLSWSYYGERAVEYLAGEKGVLPYKIVFCILAVVGAVWKIDPVLNFSDIMLGLMVVPNLIAVIFLMPTLLKDSEEYFKKLKAGQFKIHK